MSASEIGKELVKHFEGFHLKPYICPAGKLTIGIGHVIKDYEQKLTKGITEKQANELFEADFRSAANAVDALVTVPLNDNQLAALTSFVFNIGINAFGNSTLLRLLNKNQYDLAGDQFKRWNKARAKSQLIPLAGLTRRRACEEYIFRGNSIKELNEMDWFRS